MAGVSGAGGAGGATSAGGAGGGGAAGRSSGGSSGASTATAGGTGTSTGGASTGAGATAGSTASGGSTRESLQDREAARQVDAAGGDSVGLSEEAREDDAAADTQTEQSIDALRDALGPSSGTTTATVGTDADTVWGALENAGFTAQEIANNGLVDKVAELSNLRDPNTVQPGQELTVPTRDSVFGNQNSNGQAPAEEPGATPPDLSFTEHAALKEALGEDTLRNGARNDSAVEALQGALNDRLGGDISVDGDFGPETERAVREFQERNGLTVDGKVGPETREALLGPEPAKTREELQDLEAARQTEAAQAAPELPTGSHLPDFSGLDPNADPTDMVNVLSNGRSFAMQSQTADALQEFVRLMDEHHPDVPVRLTSTTGGNHTSSAHPNGTAVDFALSMTPGEMVPDSLSESVAELARQAGFENTLNEYIHDSALRTGPHIHAAL